MSRKRKIFLFVVAMLTVCTVKINAQIYHDECKEDLRAFARQEINYESLGLTVDDTLSWYQNENWVSKVAIISNYNRIVWSEFDSKMRIDSIRWNFLALEGKFKLRSPVLRYLNLYVNRLSELDVSYNT